MALQEIQQLEPKCLFDNFSGKLEVRQAEGCEELSSQRIVKVNLLQAFERATNGEIVEACIKDISKENLHIKLQSFDDKENRNPNIMHKSSDEKGSKITPRSFLRKIENLRRPLHEKEGSVFLRLENPLVSCQANKKVAVAKHSDRSDARLGHSKVMMLSKLIREASSRVNTSINSRKEEVYSVLYGNKASKANAISRNNSNLLDALNKGGDSSRALDVKPPKPLCRNKYKLQNLFSLKSNDSGSHSKIESTISFLKKKEKGIAGSRYQSQSDLFKYKNSNSKERSLNNIKKKCMNAISRLKSDYSVDYPAAGNIMDASNVSNQAGLKTAKTPKETVLRKPNSSFAQVLQLQARQSRLVDHHSVYRHFRQMLEAKDGSGSVQAIR